MDNKKVSSLHQRTVAIEKNKSIWKEFFARTLIVAKRNALQWADYYYYKKMGLTFCNEDLENNIDFSHFSDILGSVPMQDN